MKMKTSFFLLLLSVYLISLPAHAFAEEQKSGEPLYFPKGDYKEHQSDLAPDTDPYWNQYKKKQEEKLKAGKAVENPYDEPVESFYESTTTYEVVKDKKKTKKSTSKYR